MKYRAPALFRASTEEQANEKAGRAGVLRQQEDIRSTAAAFSVEVVETIQLVDVSGTSVMEAPEFLRMLELVKQYDGLVVSALDRVFRPDDFASFSIFDVFK